MIEGSAMYYVKSLQECTWKKEVLCKSICIFIEKQLSIINDLIKLLEGKGNDVNTKYKVLTLNIIKLIQIQFSLIFKLDKNVEQILLDNLLAKVSRLKSLIPSEEDKGIEPASDSQGIDYFDSRVFETPHPYIKGSY